VIGRHNRYQSGPLPAKPVLYCPGSLGGVRTPMAEAYGNLIVPWLDLCFKGSATGLTGAGTASSGLAAVDPTSGAIRWKLRIAGVDSGAATVANDVVFTSTTDGTIYALSTRTGAAVLWRAKAPSGINPFPAVTRTMLIVGTGARTSAKTPPKGEIVAYSLPG
jgi:outer membrane protein assembly factor BamB